MNKFEKLGCSTVVGLWCLRVTPSTDGAISIRRAAALFVAQALNIELSLGQQLTRLWQC